MVNNKYIIKSLKSLVEVLEKQEEKEETEITVADGLCSVVGVYHHKTGRLSVRERQGNTGMHFSKRKPETFRSVGKMFIALADFADKQKKYE